MNMNEECLLKYLQNPNELFDLNDMISEIDENYSSLNDYTEMPDVMMQYII